MSSPLEGRIRHLAREEATAVLAEQPGAGGETAELKAQVAALTARVEELATALAAAPPPKRTTRRSAETGE
jgi:hypothetical protein